MLPEAPCFIFYVEETILSSSFDPKVKDFINSHAPNSCYFFTHKCNTSRKSIHSELLSKGLTVNLNNVITPNYLVLQYCKSLYTNFSVYPITASNDFSDILSLHIPIKHVNPDLILLCTNEITSTHMSFIKNNNLPIVFSSNLCVANRTLNCNNCFKTCDIRTIKDNFADRLIIPDPPPLYHTSVLFKQLNIQPKHTVVIIDLLRDDYLQYQRIGCKVVLMLTNRTSLQDYLRSPYDADLVIENFEKLTYFLNIKQD